ncbi:hypothetical protein NKR19_g9980, partial [Coniochaeta hoffmannii]
MSAGSSRPNRFTRQPKRPQPPQPTIASSSRTPQPSIPSSSRSSGPIPPPPPPPPPETVGTFLSLIAASLERTVTLVSRAATTTTDDPCHPSPDEHAQLRALQSLLSQAAQDFQALSALVGGGMYFENDTRPETLSELRGLVEKFRAHEE